MRIFPAAAVAHSVAAGAARATLQRRIDRDILLMDLDTRRIIEAVTSVAVCRIPTGRWSAKTTASRWSPTTATTSPAGPCPADLSATARGCETRPLWTFGEPLDPLAISEQLPERLLAQLDPAPDGYRYVRVADHVLVMVIATRVVRADVVDLADLGDRR